MRKTTVILAALMLAVLGARGAEARVSAIGPDLLPAVRLACR